MILYIAPATIAVAAAVALEEAGLPYEARRLEFRASEQRGPDYLALNPKGRVPLLIDGELRLTETGAILEYIHARAPEAGLMPEGAEAQARIREALHYFAATMHVAHAHKLRGTRWADRDESLADMRAKVPQTMGDCAAHVEAHILTGPFVLGDRLSIADAHLFAITCWLPGDGVDITAYPKLAHFHETMEARPSVQAVRAAGFC
ncbi:glutathione S-transferase family protein [Litorisediminicola beolgyonensis]|uniref:Glutathione S-transferase family protein n=1 Tax=Litorisediminicola beolgyonensis TaxID=1173614 RepID=A0ABW3ZEZ0_9RHOB